MDTLSDNALMLKVKEGDIDKKPPKINNTNESGMYKIKEDDWVYGKINGGGSEIMMKNIQGNIYVTKGSR